MKTAKTDCYHAAYQVLELFNTGNDGNGGMRSITLSRPKSVPVFKTMLRLYIVLLLLAAYFLPACAQKEDNAWIFGYDYNPGDGLAEGIYFSFIEVENSEGLNPGTFYDNCIDNDGYNLPHNMVLLPYPGYHDRYALFHLPGTFNAGYGYYYAIMNSCFDMSANNGNGTTLYKNQVIIPGVPDGQQPVWQR